MLGNEREFGRSERGSEAATDRAGADLLAGAIARFAIAVTVAIRLRLAVERADVEREPQRAERTEHRNELGGARHRRLPPPRAVPRAHKRSTLHTALRRIALRLLVHAACRVAAAAATAAVAAATNARRRLHHRRVRVSAQRNAQQERK